MIERISYLVFLLVVLFFLPWPAFFAAVVLGIGLFSGFYEVAVLVFIFEAIFAAPAAGLISVPFFLTAFMLVLILAVDELREYLLVYT